MAYDLLIKNGMLVDGTGAPARRADVAITGGKIAEIGRVTDGADTVIDAGAFGFSTTILNQHVGFQGRPLACRNAGRDELKAYANALKERGKGATEIALTRKIAVMDDEEYESVDVINTLRRRSPHSWPPSP